MSRAKTAAVVLGAAMAAPPVFVAARALRLPLPLAIAAAAAVVAGLGFVIRPAFAWHLERPPRPTLVILWCALVAIGAVQMIRLGIFMSDGGHRAQSMFPYYDTIAEHSCLSAYDRAADLSRAGEPDLYEAARYGGKIGAFKREIYEYPPPFLLLPRLLQPLVAHDFLRLRALWFGLVATSVVTAMALLVRLLGARAIVPALLLPAVLGAMPTLLALQYGNFHLAAVALGVLSIIGLRSPRPVAQVTGGALLAFVTLAKLFPGLLLIPLLVEKRWRALFWTSAWLLIWTLGSMAILGPAPMEAFLRSQLTRIATGAAFPFLVENERVIAANMSIYALVIKIGWLTTGQTWSALARAATWLAAAALIVVLAVGAARKRTDNLAHAQLWMAALQLGALVSPFAPNPYAGFAALWLIALLVPDAVGHRPRAVLLAAGWLTSSLMVYALPLHAGPALVALSLLAQLFAIAIPCWAILRGATANDPLPASGLQRTAAA